MTDKHFLLIYDLAPDYLARRPEFRGAHLALGRAAIERGDLVLAGALAEPADGAVLLFKGANDSAARAFAAADPYVQNGLVVRWTVRSWTTVLGKDALTPV